MVNVGPRGTATRLGLNERKSREPGALLRVRVRDPFVLCIAPPQMALYKCMFSYM